MTTLVLLRYVLQPFVQAYSSKSHRGGTPSTLRRAVVRVPEDSSFPNDVLPKT